MRFHLQKILLKEDLAFFPRLQNSDRGRKKASTFTYWEKVNDIDLSVFALTEDGNRRNFRGERYQDMINNNHLFW